MTSRDTLLHRAFALVACALLAAAGQVSGASFGSISPSLLVTANGQETRYDLGSALNARSASAWEIHGDGFDLSLRVADPAEIATSAFIQFGIGVETLTENPVEFSFHFEIPTVLTGPTQVSGELEGLITDLRGDGVAFDPLDPKVMTTFLNATEVFALGDGLPHPRGTPGGPIEHPYGPYSYGPAAGPDVNLPILGIDVRFGLSGYDRAALQGRFDASDGTAPVPEPASFALLGVGLGAVLIARKKRA